jgi:hypothetical protein
MCAVHAKFGKLKADRTDQLVNTHSNIYITTPNANLHQRKIYLRVELDR